MNGYRQSPFANISPVVKNLLIVNIIFFIAMLVLGSQLHFDLNNWLAAYYFGSPKFHPWTLITYMFMHAGIDQPMHIFFNMFALFSFGPTLEYAMGSKKFFNFYFICGLGGILLHMLVQAVEVHQIVGAFTIADPQPEASYLVYGPNAQKLWDIYHTPIVGASGAIFGLLIAFGMMFPNLELMIMFIPVPIKAKYIIPMYVLLELYLGFKQNPEDHIAHFAHLGGALLGFIMVKIWRLQNTGNYS